LEAKSFNENSMLVKVIKLCNIIFVILYTVWFIFNI
ncbi:TPA: peptidase, partial [Streptococcus agalactiae]